MTGKTHRKFSVIFGFIITIMLYREGLLIYNYYLTLIMMCLVEQIGATSNDLDLAFSNSPMKSVPARIGNFVIHALGGKHRNWVTHSIDLSCVYLGLCTLFVIKLEEIGIFSQEDLSLSILLIVAFFSGWFSHLIADCFTTAGIYTLGIICIIFKMLGKHHIIEKSRSNNRGKNKRIESNNGKKDKDFSELIIRFVPYKLKYWKLVVTGIISTAISIFIGYINDNIILYCIALVIVIIVISMRGAVENGEIIFKTGDTWENYFFNMISKINIILGALAVGYPLLEKMLGA